SGPHSHATAPTLARLWDDLAADDAQHALRAAFRLARTAGMEEFSSLRLKPVPRPDDAAVHRHLRDLGSPECATRKRAENALRACGHPILTALKKASVETTDIEVRLRLRKLMAQVGAVTPEWLRQQRAILALEVCASPEARRLLQRLAAGAP